MTRHHRAMTALATGTLMMAIAEASSPTGSLLLIPQGSYVINVGDSRAYASFQDGSFRCLTQDHTLVQDMVKY